MVLEAQVQGFVARVNSKLGSIDEAGPVQFFLNINPNVRRKAIRCACLGGRRRVA